MAPTSRWDAIAQAGQGSRCQALVGHPEHHGGICKQNQPPERNGLGKKELRWGTRWEMAPTAPLIPPAGLHRASLRGSGSSQLCWMLFLMGSLPEPLVPWLYLPSEFEMWIKQSWQGNYSSLSNIALGLLSADSWRVMNPFVFAAALDSLQEKVQTGREVLH